MDSSASGVHTENAAEPFDHSACRDCVKWEGNSASPTTNKTYPLGPFNRTLQRVRPSHDPVEAALSKEEPSLRILYNRQKKQASPLQ